MGEDSINELTKIVVNSEGPELFDRDLRLIAHICELYEKECIRYNLGYIQTVSKLLKQRAETYNCYRNNPESQEEIRRASRLIDNLCG